MKSYVPYYEEGQEMDPASSAPQMMGTPPEPQAQAGGQDALAQVESLLPQYAQSRAPELAVQICDILVQSQPAAGGPGGDPNAGAAAGAAPAGPEGGPPPMGRYGMQIPTHQQGGTIAPRFRKV